MVAENMKLDDQLFDATVSANRASAILRLICNEYFDSISSDFTISLVQRDYTEIVDALSVVMCLFHETTTILNSIEAEETSHAETI